MKSNAPNQEHRCPACCGLFTLSSGNRKRKVQCPRCRALVILSETVEVKSIEANAAGISAPPLGWMARCEQLQVRIEILEQQVETLEQQVESLLVSPRLRAPLIPEPPVQDGNQGPRDRRLPEHLTSGTNDSSIPEKDNRREVPLPPKPLQTGKIRRNVQQPTLEISLLVNTGDAAARQLAESLTETLCNSGWKVRGVSEDTAVANACFGVTLAASSNIPLDLVTGTLDALSAVGLATTLQFDPERGTNESILIVGAAPPPKHEASTVSEAADSKEGFSLS